MVFQGTLFMNKDSLEKATVVLLVATLFAMAFNALQISDLKSSYSIQAASIKTDVSVIPKGAPDVYGSELGVKFDDISSSAPQKTDDTIKKLALLDLNINLDKSQLERYIKIASQISCEYCCDAESIIFKNGDPACGCAHSYAMRGVAKYLITKHGSEYTDDQILEELGKWKTLFFPSQITAKADILQSKGVELNYINLASNKYRGLEKGAEGGMVGGC